MCWRHVRLTRMSVSSPESGNSIRTKLFYNRHAHFPAAGTAHGVSWEIHRNKCKLICNKGNIPCSNKEKYAVTVFTAQILAYIRNICKEVYTGLINTIAVIKIIWTLGTERPHRKRDMLYIRNAKIIRIFSLFYTNQFLKLDNRWPCCISNGTFNNHLNTYILYFIYRNVW
jgi:hypothetical protein